MSEFLEAYAESMRERFPDLLGKLHFVFSDTKSKNGNPFADVLGINWNGLHETRNRLITVNHRGAKIWYSSAKSLEEIHDDLTDPRSLDRLDRFVRRLILAAQNTENEIISLRGNTHGTEIRPDLPRRSEESPSDAESSSTCPVG